MTKDEALKLALEALNDLSAWNDGEVGGHMDEPYSAEVARRTITAIKEALAQPNQFNPDWDAMAVMVEEQHRMAKRIEDLEIELEQVQYKYGPESFQIYLPLYSSPVNNEKLPWVYDQDRSSGNVASMWVTPVARMGANGRRSAT